MQSCFVLSQCGETDHAIAMGEEALVVARRVGGPFLLSQALFHLGLAYRSTDLEHAARLLDQSLALPRCPDRRPGPSGPTSRSASSGATLGDNAAALSEFAATVEASRQSGDRFVLPTALQGMAHACRQLGRLHDAARLLAAADGLAEQVGSTGGPADLAARNRHTSLRELLGDERFDTEWKIGRALSFEDTIAFALEVSGRASDAI